MELEQLEELLPTTARQAKTNPKKLVYLAIAPPKWGKTTFFCDVPDALLVAFERGFQFQKTPTVFIDKWDDKNFEAFKDEDDVVHMTMKQLEKSLTASDKYQFIIFDTADMAAKKCSDYHLNKYGWQHAQDGGDYGKGYDIVQNAPFRQMIGSIMSTGRGIALITHSEIKTTDFKKGKQSKKETSLPGGVHKFLHTQADIIFHGSFGVRQKGNQYRDRIWQTEGDEETLAGNRTRDLSLPVRYIVDPERPWAQWEQFFNDPTAAIEAETALARSVGNRKLEATEQAEVDEQPQQEQPATSPKRGKNKISA